MSKADDPSTSQFVVFGLWTRFGPQVTQDELPEATQNELREFTDNEGYEQCDEAENGTGACMTEETKRAVRHNALRYAMVLCHTVHPLCATEAKKFVATETSFLVDPIGITHVDLLNRSVDVSLRALRRILYEALTDSHCPNGRCRCPDQHCADRQKFFKQISALQEDEADIVNMTTMKAKYIGDNVLVQRFSEYKPKGNVPRRKLVTEFNEREEVRRLGVARDTERDPIRNFVLFDSHFADPRFVSKFLERNYVSGTDARKLVSVLDEASHQRTLKALPMRSPMKLERVEFYVAILRRLVKDFARKLKLPGYKQFPEFKALGELVELLKHYRRWCERRDFLCSEKLLRKVPKFWERVCRFTLTEFLKTDGELARVDDRDESQLAMKHLLSIYQRSDARSNPMSSLDADLEDDCEHDDDGDEDDVYNKVDAGVERRAST